MKQILTILLSLSALLATAQTYPLTGEVVTPESTPLPYATVVLLNPADSVMQAFGITNREGHFDIKNIRKGDYLLQVAFLGYKTFYKQPFPFREIRRVASPWKPVPWKSMKCV